MVFVDARAVHWRAPADAMMPVELQLGRGWMGAGTQEGVC